MKKTASKITHEGTLGLGEFTIDCYILEEGTRVLSSRGMQNALKVGQLNPDKKAEQMSGVELSRFLASKWFNSLITSKYSVEHFRPIICFKGKQKINGFEATVLVDMCDLILQARKDGVSFSDRQNVIAEQCEILIRSFAKVGIIALVDEATGYQYEREHDELQKILKAYISEELLPWQKKFPDEFYKELFRLNGWDYTIKDIKRRPGVIGKWTNTLVYEQLPPGVLKELKNKTPKNAAGRYKAKLHQSLTDDIGDPNLAAQINQIIMLFRLSDNMRHMWSQLERAISRQHGQMEIPFALDRQGHTIEPLEESNLSEFNKNLKTALSYNPKE